MPPPTDPERAHLQARLAQIREDISTRLWPVNQGMSSKDFNGLMDQMALLQFNFEQRNTERLLEVDRRIGEPERRATDEVKP